MLAYEGKEFEIDVYPFWQDRAVMEIELADEAETVALPPEIEIIKEDPGPALYLSLIHIAGSFCFWPLRLREDQQH